MNTFKTALVICAMLSACASCSSNSYQSSVGNQGSQAAEAAAGDFHGGMTGGSQSHTSHQQNSPVFAGGEQHHQQKPAVESIQSFEAEKARPVIVPAAAPTTTQYICSCITINPVAPTSPHHHQVPVAGDSFAPAHHQETSASSQQQNQHESIAVGTASSSQSVPVQQQHQSSASDNRGY